MHFNEVIAIRKHVCRVDAHQTCKNKSVISVMIIQANKL
jgi:hypothetical protein